MACNRRRYLPSDNHGHKLIATASLTATEWCTSTDCYAVKPSTKCPTAHWSAAYTSRCAKRGPANCLRASFSCMITQDHTLYNRHAARYANSAGLWCFTHHTVQMCRRVTMGCSRHCSGRWKDTSLPLTTICKRLQKKAQMRYRSQCIKIELNWMDGLNGLKRCLNNIRWSSTLTGIILRDLAGDMVLQHPHFAVDIWCQFCWRKKTKNINLLEKLQATR
jgi:hypothetical protein